MLDTTYDQTMELQKLLKEKGYIQHNCGNTRELGAHMVGNALFVQYFKSNEKNLKTLSAKTYEELKKRVLSLGVIKTFEVTITRAIYENTCINIDAESEQDAKDKYLNLDIDLESLNWVAHETGSSEIESATEIK